MLHLWAGRLGEGKLGFKEWARSWARRAIIQCAVRAINPTPTHQSVPLNSNHIDNPWPPEMAEFAAILELSPFERFVYVIVVLERYSIQDCSVLLGYSRRDVVEARLRALQQIGNAAEVNLEQQLSVG
jgi:DNA-directed RNA polymerase specialized sigma24 family protein